jgi:hypothetical protein
MKLKSINPELSDDEKDLLIGELDVSFAVSALTTYCLNPATEQGAGIALRILDELKKCVQCERDWQIHGEANNVMPFDPRKRYSCDNLRQFERKENE